MYDLDAIHLAPRLLQLYPAVIKEASGRKDAASAIDAFKRNSEDASTDLRNGDR